MKKATCKDLRGACDTIILGATPEEMGENSKKHVMKMVEQNDQVHLDAIADMKNMSPDQQRGWYEHFKQTFDNLPEA